MPLKFRMVAGIWGASRLSMETDLFWMTGSVLSAWWKGIFGFSLASRSGFDCGGQASISRSGGEVSL